MRVGEVGSYNSYKGFSYIRSAENFSRPKFEIKSNDLLADQRRGLFPVEEKQNNSGQHNLCHNDCFSNSTLPFKSLKKMILTVKIIRFCLTKTNIDCRL